MSKTLQAIRGMNDILPNQVSAWQYLETCLKTLASAYGYDEIRMPLLEQSSLFKRSVGSNTDIVQKEMYQFQDQNGDLLALRPEGTASCVRACLEHGLIYHQTQRLWYLGAMYRRERPQKGRYRQFYQFGLEAFGFEDNAIEVEQLCFTADLWQQLGLANLTLEINHLGSPQSRNKFKTELVQFLTQHFNELDPDSQNRLNTNPLRILDSKNHKTQSILTTGPKLYDHLSDSERSNYQTTLKLLDGLNVPYQKNPNLVRGLDYYNGLVFEWISKDLGAQGTLCAGGRYDGLVEQLGGHSTPGFGFAMGLERILSLLKPENNTLQNPPIRLHILCAFEPALQRTLQIAQQLRKNCPNVVIVTDHHGYKLKNQLKRANKAQADFAIIMGEQEFKETLLTLKPMQQDLPQQQTNLNDIIKLIQTYSQPNRGSHENV